MRQSGKLDDRLTSHLIGENLISEANLQRALSLSESKSLSLDRALLRIGLVEEDPLLGELAKLLDLSFCTDGTGFHLDLQLYNDLTGSYCQTNRIAPVVDTSGQICILINDPANHELCREVAFFSEMQLTFVAAPWRVIRPFLENTAQTSSSDAGISEELRRADEQLLEREDMDGPVIRFVSDVLQEAVTTGASDIHFESQEDGLRIRQRVDGLLKPGPSNSNLNPKSILARVKILAGMNVSERRLPQDGRITATVSGRKVDFRVSSVPTSFGESIVCRVLDPKALRIGWEKLGFSTQTIEKIIDAIEQPSGLFLVTGPTGSGKTTTLYTALSHLNRPDRKILTVEDPVEYNLAGIEQVQVHDEIGMTFAKALRAFLRQDPNIIMIGEIRDQETAEIACRAALVGRMVLSTLHTNSPEGAVTRLTDLGVPDYIVKDVLRGVLGQKLEGNAPGQSRELDAKFIDLRLITD